MPKFKPTTHTQPLQVLMVDIDFAKDTYLDPVTKEEIPLSQPARSTAGYPLIPVPPGTMVLGGSVVTTTAFVGTGGADTALLSIKDATTNTNLYSQDSKSGGARPMAANPLQTKGAPLSVHLTSSNTSTRFSAGAVKIILFLANKNFAQENI